MDGGRWRLSVQCIWTATASAVEWEEEVVMTSGGGELSEDVEVSESECWGASDFSLSGSCSSSAGTILISLFNQPELSELLLRPRSG